MKSEKLTSAIRSRLLEAVLDHRFAPEEEENLLEQRRIAVAVYEEVFPVETRRKMLALPAGWLATIDYVHAQFSEDSGDYEHMALPTGDGLEWRAPYDKQRGCMIKYDADSEMSKRFKLWKEQKQSLYLASKELKFKTKSVLDSCTTTNRLIKVWPEIQPFLLKAMPETNVFLPAPIINDLTTALRLEEAA
jgi:hypothetical protein